MTDRVPPPPSTSAVWAEMHDHVMSLTVEQRSALLLDVLETIDDPEDAIAVLDVLTRRGLPVIRLVRDHRKEVAPPRAPPPPRKTIESSRIRITVSPDVAARWPGGGAALAEILLGAHITPGRSDRSDRVQLRRRTERQGIDVTAIAARRGDRELHVIEATDMAATRRRR